MYNILIKFGILLIFSCTFIIHTVNAQNVDSLLAILHTPHEVSIEKIEAFHELWTDTEFCLSNPDSCAALALAQYNYAKQEGLDEFTKSTLVIRISITSLAENYYELLDLVNKSLNNPSLDFSQDQLETILICKVNSLHKIGRSEESLKLCKSIQEQPNVSKETLAYVQNEIGIIYYRKGDYFKAIDSYQKYLEIIQAFDNVECKKAIYYTNMGNIHYVLKKIEIALEYYECSIESHNSCGKESQTIIKLANIAKINVKHHNYDKALEYYQKSTDLARKYGKEALILDNQTEVANIYIKQNQNHKAQEIFSNLEAMVDEVTDYEAIAYYYYSYGKFKLVNKSFKTAYEACEKGFRLCEKSKHLYGKKLCANCLVEVSEKRADWKNSFNWQKIVTAINNSINNEKAIQKLAKLEVEWEYKEKKAILEQDVLSLKLNQERQQKNKTIILLLLAGSIFTAIVLTWIYFSEKKKGRLLKEKNNILKENIANIELIEKQEAELRKQEKLKTDFITNVAHEFQTPLTIIRGQASNLIKEDGISLKGIQTLEAISRNSNDLSNLTTQILEVAKSTDWTFELNINKFYLYELLNPIIEKYKVLAEAKKLKIDINYNETQELVLITDAYKLKNIIVNLLSNAIKFSRMEGSVSVNCRLEGQQLAIDIEDNGIGISEEELPNIFKRFHKTYSADNLEQKSAGVGLGLAICKDYSRLIKGQLDVQSMLNKGSVFSLKIPIKLEGTVVPLNKDFFKPLTGDFIAQSIIPDNVFISKRLKSILIVEDNRDIWFYLQNLLKDKYNLVFRSNGKEALSYLENSLVPDLIITDVMMPQMDGISMIKVIKNNIHLNQIPILVLTARNDLADIMDELDLNIDDYIIKPFENIKLVARIEYLFKLIKDRELLLAQKRMLLNENNQIWLAKIEAFVCNSLGDFNLTAHEVAQYMGLSEVHLNRKMKAMIGLTASKYISETRLKKAFDILEKKEMGSVKEVCYSVGFKSPKYFAKSFRQRFGKNPNEYLK